jgi:hypothetical protein
MPATANLTRGYMTSKAESMESATIIQRTKQEWGGCEVIGSETTDTIQLSTKEREKSDATKPVSDPS